MAKRASFTMSFAIIASLLMMQLVFSAHLGVQSSQQSLNPSPAPKHRPSQQSLNPSIQLLDSSIRNDVKGRYNRIVEEAVFLGYLYRYYNDTANHLVTYLKSKNEIVPLIQELFACYKGLQMVEKNILMVTAQELLESYPESRKYIREERLAVSEYEKAKKGYLEVENKCPNYNRTSIYKGRELIDKIVGLLSGLETKVSRNEVFTIEERALWNYLLHHQADIPYLFGAIKKGAEAHLLGSKVITTQGNTIPVSTREGLTSVTTNTNPTNLCSWIGGGLKKLLTAFKTTLQYLLV